jgi:serine protease Do
MRIAGIAAVVLAGSVLAQAASGQVGRPDPNKTKSSESLRNVFREVVASADKSTVVVQGDIDKGKMAQVALGTVIAADGYILTKASEVVARDILQVTVNGKQLPAKVVGVSEPQDLAMLKIDVAAGTALNVVSWADLKTEQVEVGEWVASAGTGAGGSGNGQPIAVGVVSVGRRKIAGRNGFLGVTLAPAEGQGAKIQQVLPDSAAEKAGLRMDDIVTAVNAKAIKDHEGLIEAIHEYRPGDVVNLAVKRGEQTVNLKASLGTNAVSGSSRFNMMNLMGGPTSKRSSDFTAVFQHDTVIRPVDCGGPIVDLSGKAIGINIARAGRTETYALPADLILPLIEPLKSGKLAPVNAKAQAATKPGEKPTTRPDRGE